MTEKRSMGAPGMAFTYQSVGFSLGFDADDAAPVLPVTDERKKLLELGRELLSKRGFQLPGQAGSAAPKAAAIPSDTAKNDESKPKDDSETKAGAAVVEVAVHDDKLPPKLENSLGDFIAFEVDDTEAAAAAEERARKQQEASTSKVSSRDIEAMGKRPYWMARCSQINSPFLRLHQGGSKRKWVNGHGACARAQCMARAACLPDPALCTRL